MGSAVSIFSKQPISFSVPQGGDERGMTFPLTNPDNESLKLAQREQFDVMCMNILWGSEDVNQFGELLRGVVLSFKPTTRFDLELLHNIVALQWKLRRLTTMQRRVFDTVEPTRGKNGMPNNTIKAYSYSDEISKLTKDLQVAIATYRAAVTRIRR